MSINYEKQVMRIWQFTVILALNMYMVNSNFNLKSELWLNINIEIMNFGRPVLIALSQVTPPAPAYCSPGPGLQVQSSKGLCGQWGTHLFIPPRLTQSVSGSLQISLLSLPIMYPFLCWLYRWLQSINTYYIYTPVYCWILNRMWSFVTILP